ncbi:hypothetical protein SAMN04488103_11451 [Gemmobacter aquatilis]|uniref:Uncharacterized protein n=1 Tax=Gemmobacter aquatilis TaxID=933059 RepID=A0A1H8MSV8_9RHOB|nr:hypothetical protein SAMN04488103_11451 [Gemmobacter aquatilis]
MKVFLTQTAEACLWPTRDHDKHYSESLAEAFQRDIDRSCRMSSVPNPRLAMSGTLLAAFGD